MFARKVENVKRNENPWPSMEDRGGEHRKKLRRKKEVEQLNHG